MLSIPSTNLKNNYKSEELFSKYTVASLGSYISSLAELPLKWGFPMHAMPGNEGCKLDT